MGAIGNYIHLTYEGYAERRGLHFTPYLKGVGRVIAGRQRSFNNWINKAKHAEMAHLEKQINNDLAMLNNFQQINKGVGSYPESNATMQAFLDDVSRNLTDKYFRVDLLAAAAHGLLTGAGEKAGLASTKGNSNASATQQAIAAQVNSQLNDLLDGIISEIEGVLSNQGISQKMIETQVNNSKGKIHTLISKLNSMARTIDIENTSTKGQIDRLLQNLAIELENGNPNLEVKEIISNFINGVTRGSISNSNYKGEIGEAITAAAATKAAQSVFEHVADSMQVVGGKGSKRVLVMDNLTPSLRNKATSLVNSINSKNTADYLITSENSKDKVDVTITFKDLEPMNISVKNYSPKALKTTGFQNKTGNLLQLLQNENHNDLINHYLNLVSIKDFAEDGNRNNLTLLLKKIVVAKLITGYNTVTEVGNMAEANVFAVYQANGEGASVKLYSMQDVLNAVFSNDKYTHINVPSSLVQSNMIVDPGAKGKAQVAAIQTRIANVVSQLNRQVSYTFALSDLTK